jgi:hypothetical protein
MPEPIGSFVTDDASGKPAPVADTERDDSNQSRTDEPEIINGYEAESPATERISVGRTESGEPRRTKSGAIDRRTLRGKGRAGSSTSAQSEKESVRLESLKISDLLYSVHVMLAEMTKVREFEVDKDECEKLAEAIAGVSKYYVTAFDPKRVAWLNLAVIAGGIYGTRIFAYRNRKELEKRFQPIAPKATPKPTVVSAGSQQAQRSNGIATGAIDNKTGKIEIDPASVWGMTNGEI